MGTAKSAGTLRVLGATLVAFSIPQLATADIGDKGSQGIHTGSGSGIHTGSGSGIHTGSGSGIHTGSGSGIHTGSGSGIHTGSGGGIHTGSGGGIHTGSGSGIHTGSGSGIHTGSGGGIHTGSGSGIHTGSGSGIHTGSGSGIHTGSGSGIHTGSGSGIHTGSGGGILMESGQELVLMAPVSSIDIEAGVFYSMGQAVMAGTRVLRNLKAGDYVSVYGSVAGPGYLYSDEVVTLSEQYVPGASTVVVSGIVEHLNSKSATLAVGGIEIDFSASLASAGGLPKDSILTFVGTQPQNGQSKVLTGYR